ncbi:MAG: hypothetical protein IKE90_03960 [Bacilli bacterium]|nr:hypothetical protein [Bacilli bacterium]
MKKEKFKEFVKKNPILLKYVKEGNMTWQKFYEMYDMYGEDNEIWKDYLSKETNDITQAGLSLGLFDFIKNLDFDSIQNGVNSMQRVLSLLQDMTNKNTNTPSNTNNSARPLYKHFED